VIFKSHGKALTSVSKLSFSLQYGKKTKKFKKIKTNVIIASFQTVPSKIIDQCKITLNAPTYALSITRAGEEQEELSTKLPLQRPQQKTPKYQEQVERCENFTFTFTYK